MNHQSASLWVGHRQPFEKLVVIRKRGQGQSPCASLSLSSEENFFILKVQNKCYFFFFIVKRPLGTRNTAHCSVLQGQICPLQEDN